MRFSTSGGHHDCNCDACAGQSVDEEEIPPLPSFRGGESREEMNDALAEWKASLPEGVEPADVFASNASDDGEGYRPQGVFNTESSSRDGEGRPEGVVTNSSSSDRPRGVMSRDESDESGRSSSVTRSTKRTGVNYRGLSSNALDDEQGDDMTDDGHRPGPVLTRSESDE